MTASIRPAAVAGMFYPTPSAALLRCVDDLLATAGAADTAAATPHPPPKAVIVPHAGFVSSGPIAARLYARLAPHAAQYRRVVLLGPAHRVALRGLAVPSCSAFATPLGEVPIDVEARATACTLPQVGVSDPAHAEEHALEVQLPFLQRTLEDFSILPLVVGEVRPASVGEVLDALWGGPETLIVVSSDLSHYLPYAQACESDAQTAQRILALRALDDPRSACGASAINGLLHAARQHDLHVELVDLRNSGDTAGDRQRVVGYGAFTFCTEPHEGKPHVH